MGSATMLFRPAGRPLARGAGLHRGGRGGRGRPGLQVPGPHPLVAGAAAQPADVLLTYMNADTPRLCANRAGAHHLNSVHGLYLRDEHRALGIELLAARAR